MPSTYAHYRLGKEVWGKLPAEIKEEISGQLDLFKIGLHGPDILFYYGALGSNKVNRTGFGMHDKLARDFFLPALQIVRHVKADREYHAMQAYLYGFICHYALDRACHGYVEEKMEASGLSHSEIETEFDRALMLEDGLDPIHQKVTGHLHPNKEGARVISRFFTDITEEEVYKALKSMKRCLDFLVAPHWPKRTLIMKGLKISGHYEGMHGLVMNQEANPKCADSNRELRKRYGKAVRDALELIGEFRKEESDAELPMDERFNHTFGAEKGTE